VTSADDFALAGPNGHADSNSGAIWIIFFSARPCRQAGGRNVRHRIGVGTNGAVPAEEFSVHIEDVAITVMMLRDPQSIPALLGIVKHVAPIETIAAFGEPALQPRLDKLARTPKTVKSGDEELRMDLAFLLNAFLHPSNIAKLRAESRYQNGAPSGTRSAEIAIATLLGQCI